jgi:hypothetical protein
MRNDYVALLTGAQYGAPMSTSREHPCPDKFVRYRRGMWTKLDEIKAELAELRGDLRAIYHHRGVSRKLNECRPETAGPPLFATSVFSQMM